MGEGWKGRDVWEVGRRRTGEENLPKEGGLNKRIDNRRLTWPCTRTRPGPLLSRSRLILHLSINCVSERQQSCDSSALLDRINSRFVLAKWSRG